MAIVRLELEDSPDGKKFMMRSDPTLMDLVAKHTSGQKLTVVEDKLLKVANILVREGFEAGKSSLIDRLRFAKDIMLSKRS